jgi:radical SAM-linked protein
MRRVRLLFSKSGKAKYLSHLDLMRTFQRVFLRAGVGIRHTEGFNPHPYMNFALPLSVGVESVCELLDFDLETDTDLSALPMFLNKTMPEGIMADHAYQPTRKFTDIAWLQVEGCLVYDAGTLVQAPEELMGLFGRKELIISKKTKKGYSDTDISTMLHRVTIIQKNREELMLSAVIAAQNPSLNPDSLIKAITAHLPIYTPDFSTFKRIELYDGSHSIYR